MISYSSLQGSRRAVLSSADSPVRTNTGRGTQFICSKELRWKGLDLAVKCLSLAAHDAEDGRTSCWGFLTLLA